MNVTFANTYDIAPEVLKENGFKLYKVGVSHSNGDTHEMVLHARSEYEVASFMRNHWGWDTQYTADLIG